MAAETRHLYSICLHCYGTLDAKRTCVSCGKKTDDAPSPPYALPKRSVLNGRFLIGYVLGKGGFGITYLAWDMEKKAKVAIKEYYPDAYGVRLTGEIIVAAKNRDLQKNYERWKDLFVGEAISLFKLRDLPGIVTVKEYFPLNNTAYIVMEFLEGLTLSKYLEQNKNVLPIKHALSLIHPVMLTLINIHQRGMLHRDISPDNIIIVQNKYIKLIDFGGAKRDMFDPTNTLVTLKPGYSPIEQYYSDQKQGTYTDVYALAATLYRAITGRIPPDSLSRTKAESLLMPSRLGITLAPIQEQAILKALNINPAERYMTVGDFLNALFGPNSTNNLSTDQGVIVATGPSKNTMGSHPQVTPSSPMAARPQMTPQQLQQLQLQQRQMQMQQMQLKQMQTQQMTPQQLQMMKMQQMGVQMTPQQLQQMQIQQMQFQMQMQMQQMQIQQMQQMQMQMMKMQQMSAVPPQQAGPHRELPPPNPANKK